jgi:hypothetical protein
MLLLVKAADGQIIEGVIGIYNSDQKSIAGGNAHRIC